MSRTCKTSLLFAPLAVRVQTGCSAVPPCTPKKTLIRLNIIVGEPEIQKLEKSGRKVAEF